LEGNWKSITSTRLQARAVILDISTLAIGDALSVANRAHAEQTSVLAETQVETNDRPTFERVFRIMPLNIIVVVKLLLHN
jgi:hypothetical protein